MNFISNGGVILFRDIMPEYLLQDLTKKNDERTIIFNNLLMWAATGIPHIAAFYSDLGYQTMTPDNDEIIRVWSIDNVII